MPLRSALFALLLVACGHGSKSHPVDAGTGDAAEPTMDLAEPAPDLAVFVTATHASLPQLHSQGGPILAAPHLVTVSFSDFGSDALLAAYGDWLMGSEWLLTVGAEYGVGLGTHEHVTLDTLAPTTVDVTSTGTLLASQISAGKLPAPTTSTMYMVVYSPSTTISDGPGPCQADYAPAYHWDTGGTQDLVYGVVGTCAAAGPSQMELSLSHEVIEAATDPYPNTMPAYYFDFDDPWWNVGGEIADMCDEPTVYIEGAASYTVPRTWSNLQAAKNGDPCLPTRAEPFFDTTGPSTSVTGAAGTDVDVVLTAWSTGPIAKWGVQAASTGNDQAHDPVVTAVDKAEVGNGDHVTLTISVPASAMAGEQLAVLVYSISESELLDYVAWPIVVTVQ